MADAAIHGHGHEDERSFFTRWFMSTNHKDIGILYLIVSAIAGLISVIFTVYMRLELMDPGVQYMCLEGARMFADASAECTPPVRKFAVASETSLVRSLRYGSSNSHVITPCGSATMATGFTPCALSLRHG